MKKWTVITALIVVASGCAWGMDTNVSLEDIKSVQQGVDDLLSDLYGKSHFNHNELNYLFENYKKPFHARFADDEKRAKLESIFERIMKSGPFKLFVSSDEEGYSIAQQDSNGCLVAVYRNIQRRISTEEDLVLYTKNKDHQKFLATIYKLKQDLALYKAEIENCTQTNISTPHYFVDLHTNLSIDQIRTSVQKSLNEKNYEVASGTGSNGEYKKIVSYYYHVADFLEKHNNIDKEIILYFNFLQGTLIQGLAPYQPYEAERINRDCNGAMDTITKLIGLPKPSDSEHKQPNATILPAHTSTETAPTSDARNQSTPSENIEAKKPFVLPVADMVLQPVARKSVLSTRNFALTFITIGVGCIILYSLVQYTHKNKNPDTISGESDEL